MNTELPSRPQSAASLLTQASEDVAHSGELIRLVLAGVSQVGAWLIENRIRPVLQQATAKTLHFTLLAGNGETKSALLIPLADGSAFARSTSGHWFALDQPEAISVIEHIGFRYAPQDRWEDGFGAMLETPGEPPIPVGPFEVAALWEEITGSRPAGYEGGPLDAIEALGLKLIDLFFDNQGQLGL